MASDASGRAQGRANRIVTLAYQNGFLDEVGLGELNGLCAESPDFDAGAWLEARGLLPADARPLIEGLAEIHERSTWTASDGAPEDLPTVREPGPPDGDGQTQAPSSTPASSYGSMVPPATLTLRTRVPSPSGRDGGQGTPSSGPGQGEPGDTILAHSVFAGQVWAADALAGAGIAPGESWLPAVRYRPVQFHAQGGLGMVFLALDQELNREVALKEIKERHADDLGSRARFVKEAEVTGQLEHPGIVPIYGLGSYLDGRPFYAMRFIRGESLHEVIRKFHRDLLGQGDRTLDASARAVELRGLLRRFLDICNTVEYAHSRKVLHRDLKPGNVMVGPFGETLVVDWGLARILGASGEDPRIQGEAAGDGSGREGLPGGAIRVSPAGVSSETTQGDMVGTVGYMSPEQAEGRLEELGPASDVYSLGAILYTILTNRPTIVGTDREDVVRRIRAGDFPDPRQLVPVVPRPLAAICLKALSVEIPGRYPTPRALADDLERWLADESVEALPDRAVDRLARWVRRHRQASLYAAMTLLTVAAVAVAAALLVDNARRKADRARQAESQALAQASDALRETTIAKAEADRNFRQARKAVDDFLTAVSDSKELQLFPNTQAFRKELLTKARDYYQQFIQSRGGDPSVRAETGAASFRLAHILVEIGSIDDALRINREAVRILDDAVASDPASFAAREFLGESLNSLATIEQRMNKTRDAEASFRRSVDVLDRLRVERPEDPDVAVMTASIIGNLGNLLALTGREESADVEYRRAREILERMEGPGATGTSVPAMLGRVLTHAADLNYRRGRLPQAEALYRRSESIYGSMLREHPQVQEFRQGQADALTSLGVLERRTNRLADAERTYAQAADAYGLLVRENPRVPDYRFDLAGVWSNQGNVLRASRRFPESEVVFRKSIEVLEGLVRENPEVAGYRQTLGGVLGNLGNTLMDLKRLDEAVEIHKRAIATYEDLVKQSPTMVDFRHGFAGALQNLAGVMAIRSPSDEAIALTRRAVELQREALAASPRNPMYIRFLDSHYEVLGRLLRARKRGLEAAVATRERSKLWPGNGDMQYDIACEFAIASTLVADLESEKLRNEAISALAAAVAGGLDDAEHTAQDPDLDPLHPLPEFQRLLRTLQDRAFPADPFAP